MAEEMIPTTDNNELLATLVKNSKKQVAYSRLIAVFLLILTIVIVFCTIVMLPKVMYALDEVTTLTTDIDKMLDTAEDTMVSIQTMSKSITSVGNNLDQFVAESSESLTNTMKNIESIDFEGLNKAIKDLGDVVEPMAKFFHIF